MRIGVLTTSYPRFAADVGGSFVESFARALGDRGHEVEVLAPAPREAARAQPLAPTWVRYLPRALQRTFHGAGVPDNLRRDPLAWPGLVTGPLALASAARRRAQRWDAIVSHFGVPCGAIGEAVAAGRPHLCVWHSADVALAAALPRPMLRWTRRAGLRHWTVTARAAERLALPDPIVAPMGAHPPAEIDRRRAQRQLGVRGFVVGALARLVPIKGLDTLVDACAGTAMTLLVGGDGPLREELEARARARGVQAVFLGTVSGARKNAFFAATDVVAFPSRRIGGREEGAPVALTEARLAGRPVIASRSGGLAERIHDGVDGLLVRGGPTEWRAALDRLREDRGLATQLGHAGRDVDAPLAWPRLIQRAERALLQGRTRRVPAGGR